MKLPIRAGRDKRERDIHELVQYLKYLPLDTQYEAYIRPWRPPEDNQRDYYRVLLRLLSKRLVDHIEVGGWDEDDFHEFFKDQFGVKTTKDFDVREWSDHIDKVHRVAATLWGVELPDPE